MKNHGFTLLETIIVLAIMTMFFAVSIPFFSRFTESTKLETSARGVTSALRIARTYAITNNAPYYVFFETIDNEPSYYVSSLDEPIPTAPTNVEDKIYKLPVGISFSSIVFGITTRAVFKPTGEVNDAGSVLITDGTNTKTINVEATTGRARID